MFKKQLSTSLLTVVIGLPTLLIPALWFYFADNFLDMPFEFVVDYIAIILLFIGMGLTGMLWAVRREAPQGIMLKGRSAVVVGLTLCILSWFFALYTLFFLVVRFSGV